MARPHMSSPAPARSPPTAAPPSAPRPPARSDRTRSSCPGSCPAGPATAHGVDRPSRRSRRAFRRRPPPSPRPTPAPALPRAAVPPGAGGPSASARPPVPAGSVVGQLRRNCRRPAASTARACLISRAGMTRALRSRIAPCSTAPSMISDSGTSASFTGPPSIDVTLEERVGEKLIEHDLASPCVRAEPVRFVLVITRKSVHGKNRSTFPESIDAGLPRLSPPAPGPPHGDYFTRLTVASG